MSVSISWSLFVVDLEILFFLILIDSKVEVSLGLDFLVNVTGESFPFFLVEFFLELQEIKFLSNQLCDLILNVLEMMMVLVIDFTDLGEYGFLFVDVSEAVEPFSFGGFLCFLFDEMVL